MTNDVIEIYTDGACSGNPGNGGWGAVLLYKQHQKEISGFNPQTTNNQILVLDDSSENLPAGRFSGLTVTVNAL